MKRFFYLLLMVGIMAASCTKPDNTPTTQDVVFTATQTNAGNFKATCDNPIAQYALITIENLPVFNVEVFYLDNVIYTNTLKLPIGDYTVTNFVLMNDNGTPSNLNDDTIVQAAPLTPSDYGDLVNFHLPLDFTVKAFEKIEVPITTICFVPQDYSLFGFMWFTVQEVTVREFNFFGDFCTKYFADYAASDFYDGLHHDMVAIFKIDVFNNGTQVATYNNEDGAVGIGKVLKVQYPDYKNQVDNFEFVLSVLVKQGDVFAYKEFYTFTSTDAGSLNVTDIDGDNVYDFVLGDCQPDADLVLAPYMNLPENATMYVGGTYAPGNAGTYLDLTLSNIGSGFDIENGLVGAYCAQVDITIYINSTHDVTVFSSLYPNLLPDFVNIDENKFANINWLANNLYRYNNDWKDIQNAVWLILGQTPSGIGTPTALALEMTADALANGNGFQPQVGGWAAVIFYDSPTVQLLFTLVDP